MTEVDFVRGEAITSPGQPIIELLIIRQGRVTVMHPKGKIALASLEYGGMIGSEALLRRLSGKKNSSHDTTSKWEVTAASFVKCYRIALDEVVRNCSGSHGQKTLKLLQDTLTVQDERRRQDFKKQRSWQLQQLKFRKKQQWDRSAAKLLTKTDQPEKQPPQETPSSVAAFAAPPCPCISYIYPTSSLGSSGGWDITGGALFTSEKILPKHGDLMQMPNLSNQSRSFGQLWALTRGIKKKTSPEKELGVIARIRLHRSIADRKFSLALAVPQTPIRILDSP